MSADTVSAPPAARSGTAWLAEARATAVLAAPMVVSQLAAMAQGLVDVLLAGHLSAHVLAAVAVGNSIWVLALMVAFGVSYALPPAIAQLDGAGRRHEAAQVFVQAALLGLAVGLALMGVVRWGGPAALALTGVTPSLLPDATAFLHAISFGMPAIALYLTCRGLSEGLSRPRPSAVIGLLGLIVLAPLAYVLMYGRLGVPPLGALGCGIATAVTCWVQLAAFVVWMRVAPHYRGLGWASGRRGFDARTMAGLFKVGLPIAVSQLMESSLFTGAALVIARFGENAAAGHQIAINAASLSFMLPMGVSFAITVRVGNAAGRRDRPGVRRAALSGIGLGLAITTCSSLLLLLAPVSIAGLYSSDPAVIAPASVLLRLAGIFQLADGLQVTTLGALRGLKDTRVAMVITGIAYWLVGLPVGLLVALHLGWQAPGMWLGLIAGLGTAAALLSVRLRYRLRGAI